MPILQKNPYKDNNEYVQWPEENADYKAANAGAMLNLDTHYYNRSMGLPMNKEKQLNCGDMQQES